MQKKQAAPPPRNKRLPPGLPGHTAMRFSANQLRMLQEDLAPALPQLAPPPELVRCAPPQLPLDSCSPSAPPGATKLRCSRLAPAYLAASSLALLAGFLGAPPAAAPLHLVVAWHALSAPHSPPAQLAGVACALSLPCACALPALLPASALLASAFFALAAPGGGLLRASVAALFPLAGAAAALAHVSGEGGGARGAALCALLAVLCAQAVLSAARLGTFEVVCAVRQV